VVTDGLVSAPVSGIMGLGWQGLASSQATPFWQSLFQGNVWDQPLMAFYLTRFLNASKSSQEEPGGVFTMGLSTMPFTAIFLSLTFNSTPGATNTSLYTGSIDYQSVQDVQSGTHSYWTLPLTSLTVNGGSVTLPSGSSSLAAIDTGTTLIGGPSDQVAAFYALIPGSAPATGNSQGYYTYRMSHSPPLSFAVQCVLTLFI
jgi:cathepsin D